MLPVMLIFVPGTPGAKMPPPLTVSAVVSAAMPSSVAPLATLIAVALSPVPLSTTTPLWILAAAMSMKALLLVYVVPWPRLKLSVPEPVPPMSPAIEPPVMFTVSECAESAILPEMRPATWSIVTALVAVVSSMANIPPAMLPVFTIAAPEVKLTPSRMAMPATPPLIVPALLRLPPKAPIACSMAPAPVAAIVPVLVMPPANVATLWAYMPLWPDEIVPPLTTLAAKVETEEIFTPVPVADITPLLMMPPAPDESNIEILLATMPWLPVIAPALLIPPEKEVAV